MKYASLLSLLQKGFFELGEAQWEQMSVSNIDMDHQWDMFKNSCMSLC